MFHLFIMDANVLGEEWVEEGGWVVMGGRLCEWCLFHKVPVGSPTSSTPSVKKKKEMNFPGISSPLPWDAQRWAREVMRKPDGSKPPPPNCRPC